METEEKKTFIVSYNGRVVKRGNRVVVVPDLDTDLYAIKVNGYDGAVIVNGNKIGIDMPENG